MKKDRRQRKRLRLFRETLRALAQADVRKVRAGEAPPSCQTTEPCCIDTISRVCEPL